MKFDRVILGLGSNYGDRESFINSAINLILENNIFSEIYKTSSLYISDAVTLPNSPSKWQSMPYLNAAISGYTNLSPHLLLQAIKNLELEIGRKDRGTWAPREIDIDILIYKDNIVTESELIIPHARLFERAFVMLPLAEIEPELILENPFHEKYSAKQIAELVKTKDISNTVIFRKF